MQKLENVIIVSSAECSGSIKRNNLRLSPKGNTDLIGLMNNLLEFVATKDNYEIFSSSRYCTQLTAMSVGDFLGAGVIEISENINDSLFSDRSNNPNFSRILKLVESHRNSTKNVILIMDNDSCDTAELGKYLAYNLFGAIVYPVHYSNKYGGYAQVISNAKDNTNITLVTPGNSAIN